MLGEKGAVMTTLDDVAKKKAEQSAEQQAAVELVRLAQEQGLSLTGPDELLKQLTKMSIAIWKSPFLARKRVLAMPLQMHGRV
jgi:hypothetical protein